MATLIQPSFAAGEIGPALHGRVDIAKYAIGLRKALNCIVHPHGGISNRAGLQWIGPVGVHGDTVRLIPFQFNTTQTYILEFGSLYMRVIKDGGHVLESAKNITAATKANPCVVTSAGHGYSNGDEVYITGVGGMTEINGKRFKIKNKTTDTFELASQIDGSTNVNSTNYTTYTSGGTVARVYTLVTPYDDADLARLKFVQSADVMTLTHPSYDPRELSRTGHATWTLTAITFQPDVSQPTGVTVTPLPAAGTKTYKYKVTAIDAASGEESLAGLSGTTRTITAATKADPCEITTSASHGYTTGDTVYISGVGGMTELNGREFTITVVDADQFTLNDVDSSAYTTYTSGGSVNINFEQTALGTTTLTPSDYNDISWNAVAGASSYNVYKFRAGVYGFIGRATGVTFRDDGITADISDTPPAQRNPFIGSGNKPGTVSYFEQRRVFGATSNAPDTAFYTQTGNASNFNVSSPTQDDDAITATLNARQVNEIRHFVPMNDLVVLTSGAEWRVNSGQDSAFGPATIKQKPQSYWGAAHIPPIVIGNTILFVQERAQMIRNLGYQLESDGYDGGDLTILSSHLFEGRTISEWAYSQIPNSLVWCVMSDGAALSLTYSKEQQLIAWTKHTTDGLFKSVASVPETTDNEDAVYFVVERTINSQTVKYIERLKSRVVLDTTDVEDCFFVDSGVTYDGADTTTITGLDHLEGETVVVLADGNVISNKVVSGGSITLPNAAGVVHVGLPYTSDIETLNMEVSPGTVQGKLKKVSSVTIRFMRSRGLFVGPDFDNLIEMKWREDEVMGAPTALLTDDKDVMIEPSWNSNGRIAIRQQYPLPMTILAVIPEVTLGG